MHMWWSFGQFGAPPRLVLSQIVHTNHWTGEDGCKDLPRSRCRGQDQHETQGPQHAAASPEPRRFDTVLEDQGCHSGACFGQSAQELRRLFAPQLRQGPPPNVPFLLLLRVPGMWSPWCVWLEVVLLRRGLPLSMSVVNFAPCHRIKPSTTTSSLRPSNTLTPAKSKSLTKVLVLTLAPTSLAHLLRPAPMGTSPAWDPRQTARCSVMAK